MSMTAPFQVQYANQLQFNLGVPLTTQNLAARYTRPSPIVVERVGGQHGIPTGVIPKSVSGAKMDPRNSVCNYSVLSEDKMEIMSVLAKRDLRNKKLQSQGIKKSRSSESLSPAGSPSHGLSYQRSKYDKFARQTAMKPHRPLTAKQADRNRRLGAVQTPPPRQPGSHFKGDMSIAYSQNTSMNIAKDSEVYFPVKPVMPEGSSQPKDEIEKIQQEIEGYFLLVEQIGERCLSEPGATFLKTQCRGKQKDEFLKEEEDSNRVRLRIEEQNIRLTRNLYNLKLKVKQAQRDAAHADFSKPTKKIQILGQLGVVHRGALKALQTFVNQLPHQDLSDGLPTHYCEFALLLKQLTALHVLVKQGKPSDGDKSLLAVIDRVNTLNSKWCLQNKKVSVVDTKDKKNVVMKDWVSDTKVDKNIFVMKNLPDFRLAHKSSKVNFQLPKQSQQKQVQRGRPKKRAPGKEIVGLGAVSFGEKDRSELRSAIATLMQTKSRPTSAIIKDQPSAGNHVAWDIGMGRQERSQDPRKGYLLPYDLIAKREKAQKAVFLSNQEKRYAEPTFATSLKRSPGRPSSAPENGRHKEVNFEVDQLSSTPWIPPERSVRSRSLSSERKSQPRSPFYSHNTSTEDVRSMFPDKQTLRIKKESSSRSKSGFASLPTDRKLRSADVSNSFIDEVEHRLLGRMMSQMVGQTRWSSRSHSASNREDLSTESLGLYADLDEPLETSDLVEEVRQEAVSAMDAPTIENMKLRLAEMQREQREIRQRWSTLKFLDTQPKSRKFASSDTQFHKFTEPLPIEVTTLSKTERPKSSGITNISEWNTEPVIFTKLGNNSRANNYQSVDLTKQIEPTLAQVAPPKKLVTLKQTSVEKISSDRDRFQSYLRKHSYHPSGKFDPWKLVEEISDEILSDCLADVADEVELISEEIANHMYKSEFMVDKSQSDYELNKETTEMHQDQPLVAVAQPHPISEHFDYRHERVEPIEMKNSRPDSVASGKTYFQTENGGQYKTDNVNKSEALSATKTDKLLSPDRPSPNLSAAEPQLENISQLLHRDNRILERKEQGGGDMVINRRKDSEEDDDEYEDDYEESSKEDNSKDESLEAADNDNEDDDDGEDVDKYEYEQDEFEDATDSELEKL